MSKDQKSNIDEPVEIVDKTIEYCISTMEFWKCDKEWPLNLIKDTLYELKKIIPFLRLKKQGEKYDNN